MLALSQPKSLRIWLHTTNLARQKDNRSKLTNSNKKKNDWQSKKTLHSLCVEIYQTAPTILNYWNIKANKSWKILKNIWLSCRDRLKNNLQKCMQEYFKGPFCLKKPAQQEDQILTQDPKNCTIILMLSKNTLITLTRKDFFKKKESSSIL